jgi:hypothetical protein
MDVTPTCRPSSMLVLRTTYGYSNVLDAGPIQSRGGCSFIWALPVIVFQLQVNCLCCFTVSAARAFSQKAVCLVPVEDAAEEHSRDKLASIFYGTF